MKREITLERVLLVLFVFDVSVCAAEKLQGAPRQQHVIKDEKGYLSALKTSDAATFAEEFETEFLLLLTERQKKDYGSLTSLKARKDHIENYWRAVNPNPILAENDILKEHIRRRTYVRQHFAAKEPPYFDDRGKYYIKYGEPVARYQDPGGLKQLTLVQFRDDPNADYTVRNNESWSYENIARDFVVHFARIGQTFREIKSLTEIIISPRRRSKQALLWSDIVKKRAAISPALSRAAASVENIETSMRVSTSYLVKKEAVMPTERVFKIEKEHKREISEAIEKAPSSARQPIIALNELTLHYNLQQFRDKNDLTRVEITMLSPVEKNLLKSDSLATRKNINVQFRALLRDSYLTPVAEDGLNLTFPLKQAAEEGLEHVIGALRFFAPPRTFELTLQIKDEQSNKIGFSRQLLDVLDYSGDELMLSDIQFYTGITNENQKTILPVFIKQDMQVAPYPFLKVRKSLPLLCYFEIYNLQSAGVEDEYEVTYKLYSSNKSKNLFESFAKWVKNSKDNSISFSYTQPVNSQNTQELIALDLSKVPEGDHYQFEILVTAKNAGKPSARSSRKLTIVD
ncbi:MAG: GWxTD domain-containing protein [bacterium]